MREISWDRRHGQTDEPKQISYQKISTLCSFQLQEIYSLFCTTLTPLFTLCFLLLFFRSILLSVLYHAPFVYFLFCTFCFLPISYVYFLFFSSVSYVYFLFYITFPLFTFRFPFHLHHPFRYCGTNKKMLFAPANIYINIKNPNFFLNKDHLKTVSAEWHVKIAQVLNNIN